MAITNSIAKLVSTKILRTLNNDLVAKKICTMEPDAPITQGGDTVYFSGLSPVAIKTYAGTVSYDTLSDAGAALLIDQQNYYAFTVKDIEAFQSNIDIKGSSVSDAAYGLLNTADAYILNMYAQAGLTHTDASVDMASILSTTSTTIRKLEEKNVKANNRWMIIPPWYAEKLALANVKFQMANGIDGSGDLQWVKHFGTDIYVSNNVYTTGAEGSWASKILAGSYNSIIYAEQILKNRFIAELEGSFAGGASGLHVFGARVLKPFELICLTATQTAETTI